MGIENTQENREGSKQEWFNKPMSVNFNNIQKKLEEINSQLSEGEKKWRIPTKDELLKAIENKEIDNSQDNGVRWCWTSTKLDDEMAKEKEENTKRSGLNFSESQLYFVVKWDGTVETAELSQYGLRLIRDTE